MEFWLRSGILEKPGIRNLIKSNAWDENSRCSDSFISGINIRFPIPGFSDRFLRVTRIPYPASPVYSIREGLLIIPVFPKQTFLSQFLIKQKQKGDLTAKATVEQDWIQSSGTIWRDRLTSSLLKCPFAFVLWGIAKEISGLRNKKRKTGEYLDAPFRRWGQGILMTLEWV